MPGVDMVSLVEWVATDRVYQARLAELRRSATDDHEVGEFLNSVAERLFAAVNSAWTQQGRMAKLTQLRVGLIRMAEKADVAERLGASGAEAQSNWCWALVGFIEAALGGTLESAEVWLPVESVTIGDSVILDDGFHRIASVDSDEADLQLIRLVFSDGSRVTARRNEDEVRVK